MANQRFWVITYRRHKESGPRFFRGELRGGIRLPPPDSHHWVHDVTSARLFVRMPVLEGGKRIVSKELTVGRLGVHPYEGPVSHKNLIIPQ